jgi:ribosomal protein S18 acetylase RimI-like enzyme
VSTIRTAVANDIDALVALESIAFQTDRMSRRSFRRWLRHPGCVFLVSEQQGAMSGYILVILRRGTRLARLYSLAVTPCSRGQGIASALLAAAERDARKAGALFLRLEVAGNNAGAIALYRRHGYVQFGLYRRYYDDESDALRMHKCIHRPDSTGDSRMIPWLAQTTPFTCGPTSLMMALTSLDSSYQPSALEEVQIWREATTIFMTSGHGGCHPLGLALAAKSRGFDAEAWVSQRDALFVDGVRDENKKRVIRLVHASFVEQARVRQVPVHYADIDQQKLVDYFDAGANILILISTYRLDNRKAPHWVVLSGYDEQCLFVHDPDLEVGTGSSIADENRDAIECQHLPVARDDFAAMSQFGSNRLRAAVIVQRR